MEYLSRGQDLLRQWRRPAYSTLDGTKPPSDLPWTLFKFTLPALLIGLLLGASFRSAMAPVPDRIAVSGSNQSGLYDEPGMNRFLTEAQCDEVFPGLNKEAERASEHWMARGGITEASLLEAQGPVEVTGVRVLIKNNRVEHSIFLRQAMT